MPVGSGSVDTQQKWIDWGTDLETGLTKAAAENKPVLIDTWATWCVNCKVLEKETLNTPLISNEAKRFVNLKIQLETTSSPESKAFMERFNMKTYSLPTLLLLKPDGSVYKIIQGVVSKEDLLKEMQKL